jgi:signal transduction histidine kinase
MARLAAPAQRERLQLMQRNALRLQKLVNTLLEFSRVQAGRAQACCGGRPGGVDGGPGQQLPFGD